MSRTIAGRRRPNDESEPRSAAALAGQLRATVTDLDGYIEARASELAAPLVAAAEQRAAAAVREARQEVRRLEDLVDEIRKHLETRNRQLDALRASRNVIGGRPFRFSDSP